MSYFKSFQINNKYHAIKTTFNGKKYDSKKEATWAMYYEQLLKNKEIKSVESQVTYELWGENKKKKIKYRADFVITHNDNIIEIIDVKSKATVTPVFRLKWNLMEDKFYYEIKRGEVKLTIQY